MVKNVANFLFEVGTLKHVSRSGWWLLNMSNPETVADHSFRAGVAGFLLAEMEGVDPYKVATMTLFNDLHEARLNDLHKVGHRYIDFREAETKAHREQTARLGKGGENIFQLHEEFQLQKTKEAVVARDADLIECLAQAREYVTIGFSGAQGWIDNIKKLLVTPSAKKLAVQLENGNPNEWFQGLKKSER